MRGYVKTYLSSLTESAALPTQGGSCRTQIIWIMH